MLLKALRTASYKKNSQCKVENVRSFGNFSKGLSFNRSIQVVNNKTPKTEKIQGKFTWYF